MIATETESNKKNLFEQFFGGEFFLIRWWNNLGEFLHQARLIPFIIAVSGYHYFQVLKTHDEVFTAWPVAIFLDLLHYRTVQQAVETRKPLWIIAAILTTGVAYAFQFIFYSGPGHSGETLPFWQQLLFASVVPIGIAFMVWHHHENEQKVESTLEADLIDAQTELSSTQEELNTIQAELEGLKTQLTNTQTELTSAQKAIEETQTQLNSTQTELGKTQTELEITQAELNTLQQLKQIWSHLNLRTQAAAKVAAGVLSLDEAIAESQTPRETLRRDAKRMNGVAG